MIINDPRTGDKIDVTGWELDRLAETLTVLRQEIQVDNDRRLTGEEQDAITGRYGIEIRWLAYISESDVITAVDRYTEIIDEAIYQRDIPSAFEAKGIGRKLTFNEEMAWDRYIADIASDELI